MFISQYGGMKSDLWLQWGQSWPIDAALLKQRFEVVIPVPQRASSYCKKKREKWGKQQKEEESDEGRVGRRERKEHY